MKRFFCSAFILLLVLTFLFSCAKVPDGAETLESELNVDLSVITTSPPETEPEPEPVYRASFVGAGDNIIYYGNVRDAASLSVPGGRQYNFKPAYENVAQMISSADIAFINQETLMCGEGYEFSYYPRFNGPQDLGYDLCELGFDVVNIANNHMLDKGGSGLSATIDFWKTMPVTLIGGYSSEAEFYDVPIVETNGIRVAYISYCDSTNGLVLQGNSDIMIPYLDKESIDRQISGIKDKCDFIIASVHWGVENSFTPNDAQREYARYFADAGVDVIVGHHPHVIQPVEWIEGKGGNRTLCVYSLGNFMAEMARDTNMVGGLISFDIVKEGTSHAVIENALFTPTVFYFPSNFYNNRIYFMEDFTEDLARSHGISYYGNSTTLEKLKGYVQNTVSEEFLPKTFN